MIASPIVLTPATWMRSLSILVLFALQMKVILCMFYSMHSKHPLSQFYPSGLRSRKQPQVHIRLFINSFRGASGELEVTAMCMESGYLLPMSFIL